MKLIRNCLYVVAAALVQTAAHAQVAADAGKVLAETQRCVRCHKLEDKAMGPSVRAMASKYKGVAGAQAAVIARMRSGTKGIWGNTAMSPVSKDISDEDLKTMVAWMLSPAAR